MNGTGVGTVQVADELIADAGGFEQLGQCDIVIVGGLHTLGAHLARFSSASTRSEEELIPSRNAAFLALRYSSANASEASIDFIWLA